MTEKVTTIPYVTPRKHRKPEPSRFIVKWIQGDTMFFRWFKRDSVACAFLDRLEIGRAHV